MSPHPTRPVPRHIARCRVVCHAPISRIVRQVAVPTSVGGHAFDQKASRAHGAVATPLIARFRVGSQPPEDDLASVELNTAGVGR